MVTHSVEAAAPKLEGVTVGIATESWPHRVDVRETSNGDEWNGYVARHPDATPDHLWQWRPVFEQVFRQQCSYLVARRGAAVAGVLPLVQFTSRLFGRSVVSLPYLNYGGALASDRAALDALVDAAKEVAAGFGSSHLELRHEARMLPELPFRQHKVAMRLPLPATPDDLWKALDRKVRNQIRKAQKEALTTVSGGAELLNEFYPVFARNMRDLGTPVYSKRLFTATLEAFGGRAHVHVVRHGGIVTAAAITIADGRTVLVPWASALREYRHLCTNMLLYWHMLERAIAGGARTFDFGRSTVGAGTHHFKQQWGATEVTLHWEYALLLKGDVPDHGPQSRKFTAAVESWKRLPLWLANRVGPAIVRHIP
jgi:FemAB-related protein (PEP-CTERM system-associated)